MLHASAIASRPARLLLAVGLAIGAVGAALFLGTLPRTSLPDSAPVAPAAARPAALAVDAVSARPPAPAPLRAADRTVILANAQVALFRAQVLLDALDDPINQAPGAILERPVVLRYGPGNGGWVFQLTPDQLRKAAVKRVNGTFTLDKAKVTAYLAPIAEALRAAPRDATLGVKDGRAVLTADQPGLELDANAAFTAIQAAAADPARRVAFLALQPVAAKVPAATLRPTYEALRATLERGFILHYNGDEYKLKPATMARYITLTETADSQVPYAIGINHDKLITTLDIVARQVNQVARDPLYRLVEGQVVEVVAARAGRKLDYDATAAAMTAAFAAGTNEADMRVALRPPSMTAVNTETVQTPDLLGKASTSFSGSVSARAHNVRFGATLVDNVLIPPDAIFSLNDALGPLTLEAGFKMGFGITRDQKGALVTIPSEAGGICQVATTFFQSAYWAGLPIVERRNHSYWIPRYGQGATGRKGLDATISPPDQDLRVRNTTGNWIRVHAFSNGETVLFELYGTKPGWTVKVSEPVIKNIVKTDGRVYTDKSDMLPAGQKVFAEHRQDGFSVSVTRQVYNANGALINNLTLSSRYEPAYDRYIVGTGKAVPKP